MSMRRILSCVLLFVFVMASLGAAAPVEEKKVLRAGGLVGDALYVSGGDQQSEMISMQKVILSKAGYTLDFTEYNTMQEGFEALQNGEIDTLYPMTPFARDLEPLGFVASDEVYAISWDLIFEGSYSEKKLARIAVPGGRLAPYYCHEVFPDSELILCTSRLDCLDAVIDGKADCAIFNGFQTENIVQNGMKYSKLTYTVLPTVCSAVFVMRADDQEHLDLVNRCIARTTELDKTDYMVLSRAVAVEESAKNALIAKYQTLFFAVVVGFIVILCVMFYITQTVIVPLREFNHRMEENDKFPIIGNKIVKCLATTYNRLFDENIEIQKLLKHEAEHDGLTGVLNRRSFDHLLGLYERTGERYLLIIADVDYFKEINDQYGHSVGDQVLRKVADTLTHAFRSNDYICRLGGDEFAVVTLNPTPGFVDVLTRKMADINRTLDAPADGLPPVSLSIGASFSEPGMAKENVMRNTDAALYEVKENGRGHFRFYSDRKQT